MFLLGSIVHCHGSAVVLPGETGMVRAAAVECSDSRVCGLVLSDAVSQIFPVGPLPLQVCDKP